MEHRELDDPIFDLAQRESATSDSLELGTMFVEIAEGLMPCPEPGLETAYLPNRAYRQHESNRLARARHSLWHDPDTRGHGLRLLDKIERQIAIRIAPLGSRSQW